MVVDASALLAILLDEPEGPRIAECLASARIRLLSPVNYLEAAVIVEVRGTARARRILDTVIETAEIELAAVTPAQARIARDAYRDFGKGFHPAGLNLADCFAYALAKESRLPLLYKGEDFTQTDVERVPWREAK